MANSTRQLEFPDVSTSTGSFWCLHLPVGHLDQMPALECHLAELAATRGQSIAVARPAQADRSIFTFFKEQTSIGWLVNRGMSKEAATATIDSLGVRVHEILNYNAGDPRSLLGIAAAFHAQADILIYFTCGMSPVGAEAAHEFVDRHRTALCAIHLAPSANSVRPSEVDNQNRFCPMCATCIEQSLPTI